MKIGPGRRYMGHHNIFWLGKNIEISHKFVKIKKFVLLSQNFLKQVITDKLSMEEINVKITQSRKRGVVLKSSQKVMRRKGGGKQH